MAPLQDSETYRSVDGGREPLLLASLSKRARAQTHERAQSLGMSSSAVHAQCDTEKCQTEFNGTIMIIIVVAVVPPSRTFI